MRVCIVVTTTYTHDSRVRRTAETLAAGGQEVHVICCFSSQFPPIEGETLGAVNIHRVARETRDFLAVALARLKRPRRDPTTGPGTSRESGRATSPRMLTTLRSLTLPILVLHRMRQQHHMERRIAQLAPDVVHANDPDTLPATRTAIRRGAKLVYDAHELASHRSNTSRWERWLDLRAERRYVPHAAQLITVSPGIAEILEKRHGVTTTVIRNVPQAPRDWTPPYDLRERIGAVDDERIILHQGLRAPGRGLAHLVEAFALLGTGRLVLLGSEVRGIDQQLTGMARELGVDARVHLLPSVDSDVLLTVTAQADVGVTLLEDVSLNHRLALPNKLFEYLTAGIPVVASDLPEIRRVLEACHGGVVCDPRQPTDIADAIQRAVDPPDAGQVPTSREESTKLKACYRALGLSG